MGQKYTHKKIKKNEPQIIGWREEVTLPQLGLSRIIAKIDTGARTSALHAFSVQEFFSNGQHQVRFCVHPLPKNEEQVVECIAVIHDQRTVSDSGGHKELRYVIKTPLLLAGITWPIEITLTNRDTMRFRMLIGRNALKEKNFIVDPTISFLHSNQINNKR